MTRTGSGPATAFLVAWLFSKAAQGYYYTFVSALNVQLLAELGLGQLVVQFASHEWASLRFEPGGRLAGDPRARQRLISLGRFAATWYLVAAGLFALLGATAGIYFFSQADAGVTWQAPWLVLCLASAGRLALLPWLSLLEGCHQLTTVYRCRWVETTLMAATSAGVILAGGELWALPAAHLAGLLWLATFLGFRYLGLIEEIWRGAGPATLSWREEILPVQWRLAVSWIGGYLASSLATPFLFHYYGPVPAGQMGLTLALSGALGQLPVLWASMQAPRMGSLVAQRDFAGLDRLFGRTLRLALVLSLTSTAAAAVALWLLQPYPRFAERFLPLLPAGLLLLAQVVVSSMHPLALYLRAFKREPFAAISLVGGLAVALSTWTLGSAYGALGLAAGSLGLQLLLFLPWNLYIFVTCRRRWTAEP